MIVLDTNVVSELMKGPGGDQAVIAWAVSLPASPVTTVFARAELLAGIELLPPGARRTGLAEAVARILARVEAVLPFTDECPHHYARIVAARTRAGRPISTMDALIASIVREVDGTLATRNVRDFEGLGLDLLDPWSVGPTDAS